ncbi:MAG: radical SAM protein [Zestosphaera sp.]
MKTADWTVVLRRDSHPQELMVEVTTACNYACPHCFRFSIKGFRTCYMDLRLYHDMLDSALEAGVKRVVFSGWGEPTVHPNILEMIGEAKGRGMVIVLNTNGSRLDELSEGLVKLGVDEVFVSISPPELSRDTLQGVKQLRTRRLLKRAEKPVVKAIYTVTKSSVKRVGEVIKCVRELGVRELYFNYYIPYPGGPEGLDCLNDSECRREFNELLSDATPRILGAGVRFTHAETTPKFARSCPFATNRALFVRCDGRVTPCLYYSRSWRTSVFGVTRELREILLGKLGEVSLMNIWRDRYSEMFFRLYFNHLPSCLECPFMNGCGFTSTNEVDCWGNTPNCAHCPYLHKLSYCPL